MKHLLLLLAVLAMVPAASAQWQFVENFPADANFLTPQNHGMAVDPDGKVWVMSYYPFTGDSVDVAPSVVAASSAANCRVATNRCRVSALYVANPDGSQASFSPLSRVTLPGGIADTLGGGTIVNGSGVRVWDWSSGRGLRAGPDGNIYATYFNTIYKINYQTGEIMAVLNPTILDTRGMAGPSFDSAGSIYVTGVFPGDPFATYDANFDYLGNVANVTRGFNRTTIVLPEPDNGAGLVAIVPNYSNDVATVYQRADDLSDWDSTGVTFQGMSVESFAMHPTTGQIWVSAGSPNDPPVPPYQPHTWYAFDRADVLTQARPTPRDSIVWNAPGDGRPRGIAFSPDGQTAYVGAFNINSPAVQKFVNTNVAAEPRGEVPQGFSLAQNTPNPFNGSTTIAYDVESAAHVRLRVLDTAGREVAVLVDQERAAGSYDAAFQAEGLAAGVYVYVLEVNGVPMSRRMLVLR